MYEIFIRRRPANGEGSITFCRISNLKEEHCVIRVDAHARLSIGAHEPNVARLCKAWNIDTTFGRLAAYFIRHEVRRGLLVRRHSCTPRDRGSHRCSCSGKPLDDKLFEVQDPEYNKAGKGRTASVGVITV
jgi:hypothetical protein